MSQTVSQSSQYWVRKMRADARRACRVDQWAQYMRDAIAARELHPELSQGWLISDAMARANGARASAWIALRDGDVRAARACRARSNGYALAVENLL